jgi:prepilin-type N-terminal cleavage/methylation domain-containing protein
MILNSFNKKPNRKKAFTLVEILVVIAVIGFLSSIIFAITRGADEQGRIAKSLYLSQHLHNSLGSYTAGTWTFDEGSGATANDTSGWENNGTLVGSPAWRCANVDTSYTPSGQGCSLEFNGSSQYVNMGKAKDVGETTVTIWFNSSSPNQYKDMIDFRPGLAYGTFSLNWTGDGRPLLYLNSSNYRYFADISNYIDGNWHFLVLYIKGSDQYDIEEAALSIDTKNIGLSSKSTGNSPSDWTGFTVGGRTYGYYSGLIDEVRIYSVGLTSAQIQSKYYAGLKRLLSRSQISEQEYQQRHIAAR